MWVCACAAGEEALPTYKAKFQLFSMEASRRRLSLSVGNFHIPSHENPRKTPGKMAESLLFGSMAFRLFKATQVGSKDVLIQWDDWDLRERSQASHGPERGTLCLLDSGTTCSWRSSLSAKLWNMPAFSHPQGSCLQFASSCIFLKQRLFDSSLATFNHRGVGDFFMRSHILLGTVHDLYIDPFANVLQMDKCPSDGERKVV